MSIVQLPALIQQNLTKLRKQKRIAEIAKSLFHKTELYSAKSKNLNTVPQNSIVPPDKYSKQLKKTSTLKFIFYVLISLGNASLVHSKCVGRFVNPITDICWKCIFPLKIAGIEVVKGNPSPSTSRNPICWCARPPLPGKLPGIPISFWEPVRLVDVTRTPYCLVNMGGLQIANKGIRGHGAIDESSAARTHLSYYQIHWYVYPITYWLEILTDFACLDKAAIDLAYLTELDPTWMDDEKAFILNPEAVLFGSVLAHAACAADCVAATADLPRNELFWCMGCQGTLYPFTGNIDSHTGGVQASLLATGKFMAKLHREGLLWGTYGRAGLCGKYPMPIIKKDMYRLQMTYPIPTTDKCYTLGHSCVPWEGGKEFPYKGEDFGYLVWRARNCCLL